MAFRAAPESGISEQPSTSKGLDTGLRSKKNVQLISHVPEAHFLHIAHAPQLLPLRHNPLTTVQFFVSVRQDEAWNGRGINSRCAVGYVNLIRSDFNVGGVPIIPSSNKKFTLSFLLLLSILVALKVQQRHANMWMPPQFFWVLSSKQFIFTTQSNRRIDSSYGRHTTHHNFFLLISMSCLPAISIFDFRHFLKLFQPATLPR